MKQARSVYLDNAATTYPKPEPVYEAVESFMRGVGGSAGRSGHRRAVETGRMVFRTRELVARLLGVGDPLRVAFTKNATEALNTAIWGLLERGDHVVTTSMEHNSVMRPLRAAGRLGVNTSVVRCAPDGTLDPALVESELRAETALVVVNHVSNVTGTILPVADVAAITRARGIPLLVDAAQSAGRLPVRFDRDGIDLLAFAGHKELFGMQGTGGLCVREGLDVRPTCFGGTGSSSSLLEQPEDMPDRLESGTLNAVGLAGLGAGVEFIEAEGVDRVRARELGLLARLMAGLEEIPGIKTFGPRAIEDRVGIIPMTLTRTWPPDAAAILDSRYDIATRAGLHCSPLAHRTIGTAETGALRVSLSFMNTEQDVDYLLHALKEMAGE